VVPPRHSIVHIMSGGIEPECARETHLSGWHVATGAQSASFWQESVENFGVSTAVADRGAGGGSFCALSAAGDEHTNVRLIDATIATRALARTNVIAFSVIGEVCLLCRSF
jgi:hypothetical protein